MTRFVFNDPTHKDLRRNLRNDMPEAEQKLWWVIRGRQMEGFKFRRQYGVGPYVLDFYCPELRLGIEIDGDSHFQEGGQERDRNRDEFIRSKGITILRFTNLDVKLRLQGVVDDTLRFVKTGAGGTKPVPPPNPLLNQEG